MQNLKVKLFFGLIFTLSSFYAQSQQTIGLKLNTAEAYSGYTLFAPISDTNTYLINNCGEQVHSWASAYKPRFSCYLLDNGVLMRMGRVTGANGGSGIIELIEWDGTVIWSYAVPASIGVQHHDAEMLPNGNILLVITDVISQTQIDQAGATNPSGVVKSEKIIEVEPDYGTGAGNIVWEWSAWDHLVQDNDAQKDNFGVIADHPERINVNFLNQTSGNWLHINAIDYNADFDQIMVSCRNLSEFWIIDHSTTTAEASDTIGGDFGKGGDLLYRWGNPQSYDRGTAADQKLFRQHHTHWVTNSPNDNGKVIMFNNEAGGPASISASNVNMVELPVNSAGFFTSSVSAYAPANFDYTYQASPATSFYSPLVSGAEVLPNGNILVCEGVPGRFFELNQSDSIVWEYVNPVNASGIQTQGTIITGNNVFRCTRYSLDYAGLAGKDLTPSTPIEIGTTEPCQLFPLNITSSASTELSIYPNPAQDKLSVEGLGDTDYSIEIVNAAGQIVISTTISKNIDIEDLTGIYFVVIKQNNTTTVKKLIVH